MNARSGDAINVLHFGIDIDIIRIAALRRRLDVEAHRSRIAALDLALELAAEALDVSVVIRKLAAAAVRIDGVAADEFLLARIVKVLPARHPGDGAGRDVIGKTRLA